MMRLQGIVYHGVVLRFLPSAHVLYLWCDLLCPIFAYMIVVINIFHLVPRTLSVCVFFDLFRHFLVYPSFIPWDRILNAQAKLSIKEFTHLYFMAIKVHHNTMIHKHKIIICSSHEDTKRNVTKIRRNHTSEMQRCMHRLYLLNTYISNIIKYLYSFTMQRYTPLRRKDPLRCTHLQDKHTIRPQTMFPYTRNASLRTFGDYVSMHS